MIINISTSEILKIFIICRFFELILFTKEWFPGRLQWTSLNVHRKQNQRNKCCIWKKGIF